MSQNQMIIAQETFKAAGVIVANTFVSGGPIAGVSQTAAAATSNGVAVAAAAVGDMVPVVTMGVVLVLAGAAIAENALVDADASGRAVTHAAGVVLGRTRGAVAAVGQLVEVFLITPAV